MDVAVPSALAAHVAEQGGGLTLTGEPGELVDSRDDERWRHPVDLLVQREHRQLVCDRTALGERAAAQLVPAVHQHPPGRLLCADVPRPDRAAAPRAALHLQRRQPVGTVLVGLLQLLPCFLPPLGADVGTDPQPDPERLAAPGRLIPAPGQLGGADQGGGPLKLLRGEQPQRVAHQHGHTIPAVQRSVRRLLHALPAADGECVRRQPEVGLGLAAAGREEQQLDPRQIAAAARGGGHSQRGELEQDERELERAPDRGVRALADPGHCVHIGQSWISAAVGRDLGVDSLVAHHRVHEPEASQRLRVGGQVLQADGEPRVHLPGLVDHVGRSDAEVCRQLGRSGGLAVQPVTVAVDQWRQAGAHRAWRGPSEGVHVEQRARHRLGLGLRGLGNRQPGGPDRGSPASARLFRPVDRAGATYGELQPVPVLQLQPAHLLVVLACVMRQHVAHRHEHRRAAGAHTQLGLEQPLTDRDRRRRLPVVAQRNLDQPPAVRRVVIGVDAQAHLAGQHPSTGPAGGQVGHGNPLAHPDRGTPVSLDRPAVPVYLAGLGAVVGAPARGDGELGEIARDLEPQPHRRRDHHALPGYGVLAVVVLPVGTAAGSGVVGGLGRHPALRARPGFVGAIWPTR